MVERTLRIAMLHCPTNILKTILLLSLLGQSCVHDSGPKVFFTPSDDCENAIEEDISKSFSSIDVAVYALNNSKLTEALKAARKRGVKVRILTDSLQAAGKSSSALEMNQSGQDIRLHSVNKIMHNKFAIFDGKTVETGSFNWTEAASKQNSENCIFLTDATAVAKFGSEFERLWRENTLEKSDAKFIKLKNR